MRDRSLALVSERWLGFVGERWFRGAADRRVAGLRAAVIGAGFFGVC
jgi:hypothetical protein